MNKKRDLVPPIYIQKWLKDIPIKSLALLADLYDKGGAVAFSDFLKLEVEFHKNAIYRLPENNPTLLAIEKSAHRGSVEEVKTIELMIRHARRELENRMKESNG
jgi:hypothetical protein